MPELDIVTMQMCRSIDGPLTITVPSESGNGEYVVSGLFHERSMPHCTCKGFKFSKPDKYGHKGCKHIRRAEESVCGWHAQYGERQTEEQRENKRCPRCGGETVWVSVGV